MWLLPVNEHGEEDEKQHVQNRGQTLENLAYEATYASTIVVVDKEDRPEASDNSEVGPATIPKV